MSARTTLSFGAQSRPKNGCAPWNQFVESITIGPKRQPPMTIAPDFREFARSCNKHDVRYLIVGEYAVAFHGHPRYTKDLDVWVERTQENAERLLQALGDFGFGGVGLTTDDILGPEQVIQLGRPPLRIDLMTSVTGVRFENCYPERRTLQVDSVELSFIGLDGLRANKRALGRHQDLADLENLE